MSRVVVLIMVEKGCNARATRQVDPAALPPLRLKAGGHVRTRAVRSFVQHVVSLPEPRARAALVRARKKLDPSALTDFTAALVRAWSDAGAPPEEHWVLHVVRVLRIDEDELADRLVPGLGLDASGTLQLDFGARRFVVGFDEALRPVVADEHGKRLRTLPRITKRDDATRAEEAHRTWKNIKAAAKAIAAERIRRLDRAMVAVHAWTKTEFREWFAEHRLMQHLARRLVWGIVRNRRGKPPELALSFRIAEDGTFADSFDRECAVAENAAIAVVHPLLMDEAERTRWREVFRDYALVQPFSQLGRDLFVPTESERDAHETARWEGKVARGQRFFALRYRGWDFDGLEMQKLVRKGKRAPRAVIHTDPGVDFTMGRIDDQTLGTLELQAPGQPPPNGAPTFGELPPITLSELFRDVESLLR